MTSQTPFRATNFGPNGTSKTVRDDGSILLKSMAPLQPYPNRLTERLLYWADVVPESVFIGRRVSAESSSSNWQTITYAETLQKVRALGQALINRNLSSQRTLAILSENSLEHALLSLAAVHVGVTYAPISPPYSLLSKDFGKLRHTINLMTPGMIFVSDGRAYESALRVAHELVPDAIIVVVQNPPNNLPCELFADLLATQPTDAVEAAFERVTPDTVAKVLFTSGSTSMPKGVINTHRLWCANLQQITQTFAFLQDEPPLFVDWLPWNHTFGGNHNFGLTLYNGGSLYIDDGRPSPAGIAQTVANLRDFAPTAYFNVPKGYAELIPYLRSEPELRKKFFSRLEMIFYAGASLPQPIWDALEELSAETTNQRVPIITGLGMTESGPSAMFTWPGGYSGLLGNPVPGMSVKLEPDDDKLEARYRGPNVTPGYWRQPDLSATNFDEEGFLRTGDAVKFVDDDDSDKGLIFDGRISENFKLSTGAWVTVGNLQMAILKHGAPLVQNAVITGHDKDYVGAILYLNGDECQRLVGEGSAEIHTHPIISDRIQQILELLLKHATGSSTQIRRAIIASAPPSIDIGEITDKGSLNQRVVLHHRVEWVDAIYTDPAPDHVFSV